MLSIPTPRPSPTDDLALAIAMQLVILAAAGVIFLFLWTRASYKSFLRTLAITIALVILGGFIWQFIDYSRYGELSWKGLGTFLLIYLSEWTLAISVAYGIPMGLIVGFYVGWILLSFQDEP